MGETPERGLSPNPKRDGGFVVSKCRITSATGVDLGPEPLVSNGAACFPVADGLVPTLTGGEPSSSHRAIDSR